VYKCVGGPRCIGRSLIRIHGRDVQTETQTTTSEYGTETNTNKTTLLHVLNGGKLYGGNRLARLSAEAGVGVQRVLVWDGRHTRGAQVEVLTLVAVIPYIRADVVVTAVAHMCERGVLRVVEVPQHHHGGVLGSAEGVELQSDTQRTQMRNES
jgi:hypothetical protein